MARNAQISAGASATLSATGRLAQTASLLQSQRDIALSGASISNVDSTVLAIGTLHVDTAGPLDNIGGQLMGSAAVTIAAGSLRNDASAARPSLIASDHATRVTTTTAAGLSNVGGVISGKSGLSLQTHGAALLNSDGLLVSDSALDIVAGAIDSTGGQIVSRGQNDGALTVAARSLDNAGGVIFSSGAASVATGAFSNRAGTVASGASTSITAAHADNRGGSVASGTGTALSTQALDNSAGSITSAASVSIDTHGQALLNAGGQIGANGLLTVAAGALVNTQGEIASANDRVSLTAAHLDNTRGSVAATDTTIDVGRGSIDNAGGRLIATAQLNLVHGALTNARGSISTGGDLALDTHGADLGNAGGTLQAAGALTLRSAALDNTSGVINSRTALDILTTGNVINVGGELAAGRTAASAPATGNVTIDTTGHSLDTSGGRIVAEGRLSLTAGAVTSASTAGLIAAGSDAALDVASLTNTGTVQAGRDLAVSASGLLANDGHLAAGQDASLAADSIRSVGTDAALATLSAGRDLTLAAASVTNQQSTAQATRDLRVRADDLRNAAGGRLLAGATAQIGGLQGPAGVVNNAGGLVSATGDVTVTARLLTNDAGRIDSASSTQVTADATSNRAGVITSTTGTDLSVGALDNAAGEISSAARLSIDTHAQALFNQGGRIVAVDSLTLNVDALDNRAAGVIGSSSGTASLHAADFMNDGGTVSAHRSIDAQVDGRLGNQGGDFIAGQDLRLAAAAIDNTGGQLIANAGTATLLSNAVVNDQGLISAARAIDVTSGTAVLDNRGGRILSDDSVTVSAAGLVNVGGTVSAQHTRVDAGTNAIDNTQGTLIGSTRLALTQGRLLNQQGRIATDGELHLDTGANAFDNRAGRVEAGGVLSVRSGAIDNTQGVIAAAGDVEIAAAALVNAGGSLGAGQDLTVAAQQLSNTAIAAQAGQVLAGRDLSLAIGQELVNHGALIQSGRNAVLQSATLSNDGGLLDSHGTLDVAVAGSASNRGGTIRTANVPGAHAAGALTLSAASLDNTAGTVNAATALTLATGRLTNADAGLLQSSGGTLSLTAANTDNTAGVIVSAGDLNAGTQAFDNAAGSVYAAGDLQIDTHGNALVNRADGTHRASIQAGGTANLVTGVLINQAANHAADTTTASVAAQDLIVSASSVTNTGTLAAGSTALDGSLAITTTGALVNDDGNVQAQGRLTTRSQSLSNRGGQLVAASAGGASTLSLTTSGTLDNADHGLIAALDGSATLGTQGGSLINRDAGTVYARGSLDLAVGAVDNAQGGSLQAGGALTATTLAFDNTAGLVQAASVNLNTQGRSLTNDQGGGLLATGDMTLATGALSNHTGSIASTGRLVVTASSAVDNGGGLMSGSLGLGLAAAGQTVTNAGGSLKSAQGDLILLAATVDNDGGSIASAGTTALHAGVRVSNRAVDQASGPVTGRMTGHDIVLETGILDNTGGSIVARNDARLTTTRTDNTAGLLSAQNNLTLNAPTLVNTAGQIVANNLLTVTTASISFGGSLKGTDLRLNVQGNYANTSVLSAARNLTITANDITNSGVLSAGNTLSAQANGNLVNTDSGELSGADVQLSATGTISNAGIVNSTAGGGHATLLAAAIDNTGRIYGDGVDLQADRIANSGTGVIAARETLNLAGQDIRNTGADALLLSLGEMNLGATLDANTKGVSGLAQSFTNSGARTEAAGDLTLSARSIVNANAGLQTQTVIVAAASQTTYVIPSGSTTQFPLSQCRGISEGAHGVFCILHPELYGLRQNLSAAWDELSVSDDNGTVTTTSPHYAWNDPIYARFGVATMSAARPAEPGGTGRCMRTNNEGTVPVNSAACNAWRVDFAAWDAAYAAVTDNLQVAINAYNAGVEADNATVNFEDYTILRVASTTQQTQVTVSQPGQILSGGDMVLNGIAITNTDSRIVAGRLLFVNGLSNADGSTPTSAGIRNIATQGVQTVTFQGTSQFSHVDPDGPFGNSHTRNTDGAQPYNPAPTTTRFDLPTVVYQQNAVLLQGGTTQAAASAGSSASAGAAGAVADTAVRSAAAANAPGAPTLGNIAPQAATGTLQAAGTATAYGPAGALAAVGAAASVGAISGVAPQSGTAHPTDVDAAAPAIVAPAASAIAVPTIQRYTVSGPGQKARDVIFTLAPRLTLPSNQLFRINTRPDARYLVETDPAFTNQRAFLSSDYFAQQLLLDPSRSLQRYGDGFAEQQLVNDQILALTGRRYLSGYTNTENEYLALMDAGVAFARAYQLTPGVALSAEQMALLTTDIVWLSAQTVTLPDGTTTQVLVPQVYLRQVQGDDLAPSGALMAASSLVIRTPGDLVNSASLAGDRIDASAENLVNTGSVVARSDVLLQAANDLSNLSGRIAANAGTVSLAAGRDIVLQTQTQTSVNAQSSRVSVDRIATVQAGADLLINAGRDLTVSGASLDATGNLQASAGRDLLVSAVQGSYEIGVQNVDSGFQGRSGSLSQASITQQASELNAGANLTLVAGAQLGIDGSALNAARDVTLQGSDVSIRAATASQSIDIQTVQRRSYDRAAQSDESLVGGVITAGNNLAVITTGDAGQGAGNITVTGATLAAIQGQTALVATGDVTLQAAITRHASATESAYQSSRGISGVYSTSQQGESRHSTQSSQVQATTVSGNTLLIQAGDPDKQTSDILLLGSQLSATGAATLSAGRDLIVGTVTQSTSRSDFEASSSSFEIGDHAVNRMVGNVVGDINRVADPFMGSKLPTMAPGRSTAENGQGSGSSEQAIGSSISADTLSASAGRDALIRGSTVVTTGDLAIQAARNLEILNSGNRQEAQDSSDKRTDGLLTGGISLTVGTREQTAASQQAADTATASQVASLSGNVNLQAGETYRQSGSQVLALGQGATGGDIDITGKQIDIDAATATQRNDQQSSFSQSGVTVAITNPLITALQTGVQMAESASKTGGDARLQALAAATVVMAAADAGRSIADGSAASIGINVSVGESSSHSSSTQSASTAQGSSVAAARDLRISATEGDLNAIGANLQAGRDASLSASGNLNLQAAQSTAEQHGVNDSSSTSVGVGFNLGSQNGFTINASASRGRGRSDGTDEVYTNTTVQAGGTATLTSGGDTTLQGATVQAHQVQATVGGNLNIQSLQDASVFDAKQTSAGAGVSLCIPPICYGTSSVSGSYANARAVGDYASVAEQSGIKAGDGGFQLTVAGNTGLQGGVIASSQAAIDAGRNSLSTATLTTADIANRDAHEASAISASATVSGNAGTPSQASPPTGSAGIGSASGDASSTTRSGISAGAITITDSAAQQALSGQDAAATLAGLNTQVTTDTATAAALTRAWDGTQLMEQVQASAQITAAFGAAAARAVANYAQTQVQQLRSQGNDEEAKKWDEGGAYRVAAHAVVGGLGGGVSGALGSGTVAAAAPAIDAALSQLDLPEPVRQAVGMAAAAAIGTLASGGSVAGVGTAFNTDTNNRQLHWRNYLSEREACASNPQATACTTIDRMAGVSSQVVEFLATPVANVAVNQDATGQVVSYTILDRATNEPRLIMEPAEFQAFRSLPSGHQALMMEVAPQYALDLASAGIYAGAGNAARATEALQAAVTTPEYARDVALGLLGVAAGEAAAVPRVSSTRIDLAPPPNTYPAYTRGAGAAEGPLPPGYTTVSRWVSPEEASLWVQNQGTAIPAAIPRNGTPQLYVTEAGAPYPPGANGTVRIDFAVPNTMLRTGNAPNNFMILQPSSSTPIYNVNIHVPNGVTLPKPR